MTVTHLRHEFIEEAPDELKEGVLYVSMEYATTLHLCCCGCGNEVVLPLRPTAWRLTYDGKAISLSPSVGNWSFPCRSHYWIQNSRIHRADAWTDKQVEAGRLLTLTERGAAPSESYHSATTRRWRRLLTTFLSPFRRRGADD
jgi:hypothetical protein